MMTALLELANGRQLPYRITVSPRSRCVRLKLNAHNGLIIVVPHGFDQSGIAAIVRSKQDWIDHHLRRFEAVGADLFAAPPAPVKPEVLELPALAESWRIAYRATPSQITSARIDQPGLLMVSGAIEDRTAGCAALQRWLARHGQATLTPWLERLAASSSNVTATSPSTASIRRTARRSSTAR